jgi:EpsI family protein
LVRRDLLIGGACAIGAALGGSTALWSAPKPLPPGGLDALVPKQVGGWSFATTDGVVVAEGGRDRGPYDDLLTRVYASPDRPPVTLLVAYIGAQRADVRLHRPEACYPAAGFRLGDRKIVDIRLAGTPTITAQRLLATSEARTERLLYWTRVGDAFPTSNVGQVRAFLGENLQGEVPDAVLVRLSVPGSDPQLAAATTDAFLAALRATASREARRILFGAS